jgi:hypothetical protein
MFCSVPVTIMKMQSDGSSGWSCSRRSKIAPRSLSLLPQAAKERPSGTESRASGMRCHRFLHTFAPEWSLSLGAWRGCPRGRFPKRVRYLWPLGACSRDGESGLRMRRAIVNLRETHSDTVPPERPPNLAAPGNGAIAVLFHAGRTCRAVPEQQCSSGHAGKPLALIPP